jgi:hypothetical protein
MSFVAPASEPILHGDVVAKIISNLKTPDALNARCLGTAWRSVPNALMEWTLSRRLNQNLRNNEHGESRVMKCVAAIQEGNTTVLKCFNEFDGFSSDGCHLRAVLEAEDVDQCLQIILDNLGHAGLSTDAERLYKDLANHGRFDVLSRIARHFELSKSDDYSELLWHSYQCAAGWGDLEYMEHIIDVIMKGFPGLYSFGDDDTYDIAAGAGKIEVLDWLFEKHGVSIHASTVLHAAKHRQWHVLHWAIDKGINISRIYHIFHLLGQHGDAKTMNRYLQYMKNLRDHPPEGIIFSQDPKQDLKDIVDGAAKFGNMDILVAVNEMVNIKTSLKENEIRDHTKLYVGNFTSAIGEGGHMKVLQFFEFDNLSESDQSSIFYVASRSTETLNTEFKEEFKVRYPGFVPR